MVTSVLRSGLLDWDAGRRGRWARVVLAGAVWAGLGACAARAQVPLAGADVGQPPAAARRPGEASQEPDSVNGRVERSMVARREQEREKELEADTRKLLELAQALQADVSKTNKNELSLDVIKRAEQIEKLAHSVREKMRGYY